MEIRGFAFHYRTDGMPTPPLIDDATPYTPKLPFWTLRRRRIGWFASLVIGGTSAGFYPYMGLLEGVSRSSLTPATLVMIVLIILIFFAIGAAIAGGIFAFLVPVPRFRFDAATR